MPRFLTRFAAAIMFTAAIHAQPAKCKKFDNHGNPMCCNATGFGDCPASGCTADLKLNAAKNRIDIPAEGTPQHKTIIQIANFTHPASWSSNQGRDLLVSWGEGTPLEVTLYLKDVKRYKDGDEACNCNLDLEVNNDYHLVLVTRKTSGEKSSLTAEITPRIRLNNWTYDTLRSLADQKAYVRVTGWAMLDTQHVGKSVPKRKTHWEIHPVTKFEVCTTTKALCDAGNDWKKLEEMP
ncbi:MAG: hypothetical protein ABJB40_14185 [Acidobacteriota bacterium]